MAEYIEVLGGTWDHCPYFTVDTTGPLYVPVVKPVTYCDLYPPNSTSEYFQPSDNVRIISAGYYIPERFVLYEIDSTPSPNVALTQLLLMGFFAKHFSPGLTYTPLVQFGSDGYMKIPFPNYETVFDVFINTSSKLLLNKFMLSLNFPDQTINTFRVSMSDVPSTLHGQVFRITPFVKVLHTLTMAP